jgi:hypothetical protein
MAASRDWSSWWKDKDSIVRSLDLLTDRATGAKRRLGLLGRLLLLYSGAYTLQVG